jgi:hypothetical protein
MHEELRQAVYGQLSQTLPLGDQPFLEQCSSEGEALQQVAAVKLDSFGQRVWVVHPDESPERHDVNVNGVDVEGDGVAVQHQAGRIGRGESSPQYEQASAEAAARLRL